MGKIHRAANTSVMPIMNGAPSGEKPLPRTFYDRPPEQVARELLGQWLVRQLGGQTLGGRIVETEAYLAEDDLASHSARGPRRGNASMFGSPGTLYVYPIHAKWCLNAVTECAGRGSAVLVRALEPLWGIERMRTHRGYNDLRRLTRGPAMLCQALRIDRAQDGIDLTGGGEVTILSAPPLQPDEVTETVRIGISRSQEMPLRFFINGNRYVSGRASDHRRT